MELERAVAGDAESIERLLEKTHYLVVSIARRHQRNGRPDLDDLISAGKLKLLEILPRYKTEEGRFSSLAVPHLHAAMQEVSRLDRGTTNNPTAEALNNRIARLTEYLAKDLGRKPTDSEIAVALNVTPEELERARRVLASRLKHAELDGGGNRSFEERAVFRNPAPSAELERASVEAALKTRLKTVLNDKEYELLVRRLGLFGVEKAALQELVDDSARSRQAVDVRMKTIMKSLRRSGVADLALELSKRHRRRE